jgi:hypothetical protein
VTLGKAFAECFWGFAECSRHSAKQLIPVVYHCQVMLCHHNVVPIITARSSKWIYKGGSLIATMADILTELFLKNAF